MAKIEIFSRNVKKVPDMPIFGKAQHLYLIYTDDSGSKELLRGGPEFGNEFGPDELYIINQEYNSKKQDDGSETYDWNDGTHVGGTLVSGEEDKILEVWVEMNSTAQNINNEKYDYEILTQNSNTIVMHLARSVSLDGELKAFIQNHSLWPPADDFELKHSGPDIVYDVGQILQEGIERTYGSLEQFKQFLQDTGMNPYVWLSLVAKVLQRPIEDLLKAKFKALINKLIGNIDPLKPVIVLKESKTGRNELFVDQLTGALMDRKGFAALIDSGQYEGYTLASIDGIATPMSKPDKVTSNNLG